MRFVDLIKNYVSEEHVTSIFRVEEIYVSEDNC
jgi:hypothetical protein